MTRLFYGNLTLYSTIILLAVAIEQPRPLLLWNASPSVPTGLYLLAPEGGLNYLLPNDRLTTGDLVAAKPPHTLSRYMAVRYYLPLGLPLIKHVGALPGQTVCRAGLTITIDGRAAATARKTDHRGRSLPVWQGCHRVRGDEIFLLNPDVPDSFDGRYFGVLPNNSVIGRALPLWTHDAKVKP